MKPGYNILVGRELWGATTSNPVTFAGRVDSIRLLEVRIRLLGVRYYLVKIVKYLK